MNCKENHIRLIIKKAVAESGIEISRICDFFKTTRKVINEMYLFRPRFKVFSYEMK